MLHLNPTVGITYFASMTNLTGVCSRGSTSLTNSSRNSGSSFMVRLVCSTVTVFTLPPRPLSREGEFLDFNTVQETRALHRHHAPRVAASRLFRLARHRIAVASGSAGGCGGCRANPRRGVSPTEIDHCRLPHWCPEPSGHVRHEAGGARGNPGRVSAHRHARAPASTSASTCRNWPLARTSTPCRDDIWEGWQANAKRKRGYSFLISTWERRPLAW